MTVLGHPAGQEAENCTHGFQLALVDLDDTLYRQPKIPDIVREKIQGFMVEKLNIPQAEVADLCYQLYLSHGTTVCGLVDKGYKIDMKEWHDYIHGCLDAHLDELLTPDPALRQMLQSMNVPKYIFTNADREHTDRFLEQLGIVDCFQGIICFESIQAEAEKEGLVRDGRPLVVKPSAQCFEIALRIAGVDDPSGVVFFDDSTRNITAARSLGIHSVLIGREDDFEGADMTLGSILQLPAVMPDLFKLSAPDAKKLERAAEPAVEYAAFQ